ncbi:hypothetical protein [Bradyrhizobium sp. ARR65]|uniref:hypothetical protein n=1 Tax=Bradyrhizobium sp. ARR65 TaxID=1040989 RepID=UPI00046464FE
MSRANAHSALILALGMMMGFAVVPPAASDELNSPVFVTPAENAAQPSTSTQPATPNQVVAPDQLNDVDRTLQNNAAAQTSAPPVPTAQPSTPAASTDAPAARSASVAAASGEHSVWDETSLIGKIFIGFGALLTVASAARMFMA